MPVAGHAQIGHDFALRTLFLSLALVALAIAGPVAQPSPRPNIVMIIMDDLGYGDIGSYGAPDAKTPNIDRLAREGVKLTDFYANHANCSPTRTGFITGRYQQRYGIESPLRAIDDARQLLPSDTSLPRLLKSAGYATGLIGKWHLGARAEAGPNRHGFDEFWGFRGGAVDYYTHNVVTIPGGETACADPRPVSQRGANQGYRLPDGRNHGTQRSIHPAAQCGAVFPRGGLQRDALAIPSVRTYLKRSAAGPTPSKAAPAPTTSRCWSAPIRALAASLDSSTG